VEISVFEFYLPEQLPELCVLTALSMQTWGCWVHVHLSGRSRQDLQQTRFAAHKLFWPEEDPSLFMEREYH